jgi:hypothetical protein
MAQAGARLWVGLIGAGKATLEVAQLPPEPEPKQTRSPGPQGGANDYGRLKKIVIHEGGVTKVAWTVAFIPLKPGQNEPPNLPVPPELNKW